MLEFLSYSSVMDFNLEAYNEINLKLLLIFVFITATESKRQQKLVLEVPCCCDGPDHVIWGRKGSEDRKDFGTLI